MTAPKAFVAKFRIEPYEAAKHKSAFTVCGTRADRLDYPTTGTPGIAILCPGCERVLDFRTLTDVGEQGVCIGCECGGEVCIKYNDDGTVHMGSDFFE
jgi:hypothetical protein